MTDWDLLMKICCIKMSLHHVFIQLLLKNDKEQIVMLLDDLDTLKVKRLGFKPYDVYMQALRDKLSGNYRSFNDHEHLFNTQQAIKDMYILLEKLNKKAM